MIILIRKIKQFIIVIVVVVHLKRIQAKAILFVLNVAVIMIRIMDILKSL